MKKSNAIANKKKSPVVQVSINFYNYMGALMI